MKDLIKEYTSDLVETILLREDIEVEDLQSTLSKVKETLLSKYGYMCQVTKSTLGGGYPTFFLKVFGPKESWTGNIALNSPLHMMFRVEDGKSVDVTTHSYQIRNAKIKFRKTKISSAKDLETKLLAFFEKNKDGFNSILNEEDLEESSYKIYHKDFSTAATEARNIADKRGYVVDEDDWFNKVATGPKKPSEGKTNSYSIELKTKEGKSTKMRLHFQVYNTGKSYELNAYI